VPDFAMKEQGRRKITKRGRGLVGKERVEAGLYAKKEDRAVVAFTRR